jgi:hypothetical protein
MSRIELRKVQGSPIDLSWDVISYFQPLFERSVSQYPLEISFAPVEGDIQNNPVRTRIRQVAFGEHGEKIEATRWLAEYLGSVDI